MNKIKKEAELKKEYVEKFEEALGWLNKEQKDAVESIDGPVVVVAGPGTGKTQILTLRIANIIKQNGADFANNILALTFTDAGVKAMRERLKDFIGPDEAYEVNINTFHSFCADQIKAYPEFFQRFSFSQAISEVEQIDIVDKILNNGSYKILKTFSSDFHNTKKILSAISNLKAEAISPEDFENSFIGLEQKYIDSKGEDAFYKRKTKVKGVQYQAGDLKPKVLEDSKKELEKQKELLNIYQKYQEELEKKKLFDFNDMILRVIEEARNNQDFLERLQEQYLYILVDEHQDTNEAQNKLVEFIAEAENNEGRPNIFTVGDKKQAIYKFQGASIDEFEKVKKKYNNVKIINLKNNYRSTQNILDIAYSLIPEDEKLEAKNEKIAKENNKIVLAVLETRKEELIFIAEEIKKKIESGVKPNDIAIFFRNNKEGNEVADILEKMKIPYKLFTNENILEDREIKKFILLLEAIENPYKDEFLGKVLFIDFLNFNPLAVVKVLDRLAVRKGGLKIENKSVYKIISSENILKTLDLSDEEINKFLNFAKKIKDLKKEEKNKDFLDFLNYFVSETGFLKNLFSQENNILALSRFEKIFNEVKEQVLGNSNYALENFLRYIEILKIHNLNISVSGNKLKDGINLMTAHKSKGLEFDYVYLTNAIQSKWSGKGVGGLNFLLPISKAKSDIEDEKRLFYVAITRAKKDLVISYAKQEDGKSKANEPSIFIESLKQDLLKYIEIPEKDLAKKMEIYFAKKNELKESIFDKEYIKELFLRKTLSVSALNNYFKSPILYFFRNLIQLPSGQAKPLIFGNVIHDTLEGYFKEKGAVDILEIFENSLKKFVIPEKYFDSIYNDGKELLEKYVEKYKNDFVFENIELEKSLSRNFELKDKHNLRLVGFADKIEEENGVLSVVDYKTGYNTKQKRKKSQEELKRQLTFYKLLIDGNQRVNGIVEKGVLDFVEELKGEKDLVRQTNFISNEDVEDLKEEINDFAQDILSGDFLEREYDRVKFLKENKYDEYLFDL